MAPVADFGPRAALEKPEDQCVAFRLGESGDGLVQDGAHRFPVGRFGRRAISFLHTMGLRFAGAPATLRAHDIDRGEPGALEQPAAEDLAPGETGGFAGESREHALRHILGEVRVAADLAAGDTEDEAEVVSHYLRERGLVPGGGEVPEQLGIGFLAHVGR